MSPSCLREINNLPGLFTAGREATEANFGFRVL
jgi:hypothetical protein